MRFPRDPIFTVYASGHCISAVDKVHDYLKLRFDNGDVLNVFNAYRLDVADGPDSYSLVGKRVAGVAEEVQEVRGGFTS